MQNVRAAIRFNTSHFYSKLSYEASGGQPSRWTERWTQWKFWAPLVLYECICCGGDAIHCSLRDRLPGGAETLDAERISLAVSRARAWDQHVWITRSEKYWPYRNLQLVQKSLDGSWYL